MKKYLLKNVRLSTYLIILFLLFFVILLFLPTYEFSAAVLTLFSVNSFLYGFYLTPIQRNMRVRIVDFHKIIRVEANELYKIHLLINRLPAGLKDELQTMLEKYVKAKLAGDDSGYGEKEYRKLVDYCINYDGEQRAKMDEVMNLLVANQQNHNEFMMLIADRIYSNEWILMTILFVITFGFIMFMKAPQGIVFIIVKAVLCSGLSMLPINLIKLDTLTHKKFKEVWAPFNKLLETNFYQQD